LRRSVRAAVIYDAIVGAVVIKTVAQRYSVFAYVRKAVVIVIDVTRISGAVAVIVQLQRVRNARAVVDGVGRSVAVEVRFWCRRR
jgi:hypothetical protein